MSDGQILTLGAVEAILADQGIPLSEVKGFRLAWETRGDRESPMYLEVKRYVVDEEGSRFAVRWPAPDHFAVAYELVRIPLAALVPAPGPAVVHDPDITYEDEAGDVVRKASEIVEERRQPEWRWYRKADHGRVPVA